VFFFFKYEKNKTHNMLSLLLDLEFKNLCTMFSCSFEQGKAIVEEYNRKTLYPMLLKCYNCLHPCLKIPLLTKVLMKITIWTFLSIVDSQIYTKRIFSLVGIFTNLRICHL